MRLIILITLTVLTPLWVLASPNKARLYLTSESVQALLTAPKEGTQSPLAVPFTLQYKGKSNKGELKLRESALLSKSISGLEGLRLFRGTTRRGGKDITLAASLIAGNLKVSFKDRGRLYQSEFKLNGACSGSIEAILYKSPAYFKIDNGALASSKSNLTENLTQSAVSGSLLTDPRRLIELRAVADESLVNLKGGQLQAFLAILDTVNTAEAIYARQLNLTLRVVDMAVLSDAVLFSSESEELLDQFEAAESADSATAHDLSHLFTGKDLDYGIVGLAWLGVVCSAPDISIALTQMRNVGALASIIFAHEIGHNLGAQHHNRERSIMSAFVSLALDRFTKKSRNQMRTHLETYDYCVLTDNLPPKIKLSNYLISGVKVTSTGKFLLKTKIHRKRTKTNSCIVSLFGSTNASSLEEQNIVSQATFLSNYLADLGDVRLRANGLTKEVSGAKNVYFRLLSECDGVQSLSPTVSLTLNSGGTITNSQWLESLAAKEVAIIPY